MELTRPLLYPEAGNAPDHKPLVVPAFVNSEDVMLSDTFPVTSLYSGETAQHCASTIPSDSLAAVAAASAAFPLLDRY